jgi:hypothetical protein
VKTLMIPIKQGNSLCVRWLPSRRAFLSYLATKHNNDRRVSGKGTCAYYMGYSLDDEHNVSGEIILYDNFFDADDVAHEVTHFVFDHFLKFGMDFKENEETAAGLIGSITGNILGWKQDTLPCSRCHGLWNGSVVIDFNV